MREESGSGTTTRGDFISNPRPTRECVAIGLGGSVVAPEALDSSFLKRLAERMINWSRDRTLFVVVGGGVPARNAIEGARACGVREERLDLIGIQATRTNAQMLACILHALHADVSLKLPESTAEALRLAKQYDIVVMGGTVPGHSTDFVAAELAVHGKCARFVDATNVDGVYEQDPAVHKDAAMILKMDFARLVQIIKPKKWTRAGGKGVIDGPATTLLAGSGMTTCVIRGTELDEFEAAVCGIEDFYGTIVRGPRVVIRS